MCCDEIRIAFDASEDCVKSNVLQAKENGVKFRIQPTKGSNNAFCRIQVDGCLIRERGREKCDYWFRHCKEEATQDYFVELKGSKIKKGFDQIIETIKQAREKGITLQHKNIYGIIVSSSVPKAANVQNLKDLFKKKYGVNLIVNSGDDYTHILK